MINSGKIYHTLFNNSADKFLEPLFIDLMSTGNVMVTGNSYSATEKGSGTFNNFMKRYTEYLKMYDVFGFVDLTEGEFPFSHFFDFNSDDEWDEFKSNPRFEDVRIAVALFKKINPAEVVFMSFINENRFDTSSIGWQLDLLSGSIWNEIEQICETAFKPEQVGDAAMEDMIKQGSDIALSLMKQEEDKRASIEKENQQIRALATTSSTYYEEEVVEDVYYDEYYYDDYVGYYDPFYVSPIWYTPLFFY